ncbi:MAG: HAD family hydrolase [bacterium]|nr:HAD family hydrolase [bacterium]
MNLNVGIIDTIPKTAKHISQAQKFVKYPIKTVFSDVDGTILNSNKIASESHLLAIKKLEEAGIPLIISTGRGYKEIDSIFEKLKMKPGIIITESGAVVIDGAKNKLFENKLSLDNVQKIRTAFRKLQAPDTYFRFTFDGELYIEGSAKALETSSVKTHSLNSFDELLDKGQLPTRAFIAKLNSKSYNDIEILVQKFREILGEGLSVFNSGIKFAEITNKDVSKASAIEFLQKYFGFNFENIACIGDSANDVCMAKLVSQNGGMSVSMANGTEEMQKVSDFITEDVDNGGFLNFVNEILKINKSK